MTTPRLILIIALILAGICLAIVLWEDQGSRSPTQGSSILTDDNATTSAAIIDSVSLTLNNLPQEVVTELTPPQPILDDSKSADGREVKAILNVTPGGVDGVFNYLSVPEGNANFRTVGIQQGDRVRYFVKYDQDDLEHGFENVSYYELEVRRLDSNNMENALILEGGLTGAVEVPHRVEVWRLSDQRMRDILTRLNRYWERPKTMLGWEPSPDESALLQMADRLNQWWRNLTTSLESWQPDPLVKGLSEELRTAAPLADLLTDAALAEGGFVVWEMRLLQQAVWLRDISAWARGDALNDVEVASSLFDWTIRNVQLDTPGQDAIIHRPWHALMYGHGSAEDRAWVFAELCRHQQLDVVMLAIQQGQDEPKWWLAALVADDQLYLFDTRLGLPLPGIEPDSIATLAEVFENPALLDRLSIEGEVPYMISSADFGEEKAPSILSQTVASPLQLARRSAELQQLLETEEYVTLAAETVTLAEEVGDLPHVQSVSLWPHPFQSVIDEQNMSSNARRKAAQKFLVFAQRPKLWKARVLHFQGTKDIPASEQEDPLAQASYGHRLATDLYQDDNVRIPERELVNLEKGKQDIYRHAKYDAAYWLALMKSAQGSHSVARYWLEEQTLAAEPGWHWEHGARYCLAREYEALGQLDKAIAILEADESPQRLGNLLRAQLLKSDLKSTAGNSAEQE